MAGILRGILPTGWSIRDNVIRDDTRDESPIEQQNVTVQPQAQAQPQPQPQPQPQAVAAPAVQASAPVHEVNTPAQAQSKPAQTKSVPAIEPVGKVFFDPRQDTAVHVGPRRQPETPEQRRIQRRLDKELTEMLHLLSDPIFQFVEDVIGESGASDSEAWSTGVLPTRDKFESLISDRLGFARDLLVAQDDQVALKDAGGAGLMVDLPPQTPARADKTPVLNALKKIVNLYTDPTDAVIARAGGGDKLAADLVQAQQYIAGLENPSLVDQSTEMKNLVSGAELFVKTVAKRFNQQVEFPPPPRLPWPQMTPSRRDRTVYEVEPSTYDEFVRNAQNKYQLHKLNPNANFWRGIQSPGVTLLRLLAAGKISEAALRAWSTIYGLPVSSLRNPHEADTESRRQISHFVAKHPGTLSVVFLSNQFKRALHQSLHDVHTICGLGHVPEIDFMTQPDVRDMFVTLVGTHVRRIRFENSDYSKKHSKDDAWLNLEMARNWFKNVDYVDNNQRLVHLPTYNKTNTQLRGQLRNERKRKFDETGNYFQLIN